MKFYIQKFTAVVSRSATCFLDLFLFMHAFVKIPSGSWRENYIVSRSKIHRCFVHISVLDLICNLQLLKLLKNNIVEAFLQIYMCSSSLFWRFIDVLTHAFYCIMKGIYHNADLLLYYWNIILLSDLLWTSTKTAQFLKQCLHFVATFLFGCFLASQVFGRSV